jgi:hypothetical protein
MDLTSRIAKLLLPLLQKGLTKAAEGLSPEALERAQAIWGVLKEAVDKTPLAKQTVEEIQQGRDNPYAETDLASQLHRILSADPALAARVAGLMEQGGRQAEYQAVNTGSGALAQGSGNVAAGAGGVAVGGNVQRDIKLGK